MRKADWIDSLRGHNLVEATDEENRAYQDGAIEAEMRPPGTYYGDEDSYSPADIAAESVRQARLRTTCDWVIAETWGGRTLDDVMEEACRPDFRAKREGLAVNEILETIQAARGWSLPELLGALITEPADTYHDKADEYLSSHALGNFRRCPQYFRQRQLGIIADRDSTAFLVGRAAHTLILEGWKAYQDAYAIGGPTNPKTGKPFGAQTKAFELWAWKQGKPALSDDQHRLVTAMGTAADGHAEAKRLLTGGRAEQVIRAVYCGVKSQIRMDFILPDAGILELKTCDDLDWFTADSKRFGYLYNLAFYRAVLRTAIGGNMPVHIIAVEKKEPYRVGVWLVPPAALDAKEAENEAAIGRLKECYRANNWPTGYETVRVLEAA